jgi:hypothetical protein
MIDAFAANGNNGWNLQIGQLFRRHVTEALGAITGARTNAPKSSSENPFRACTLTGSVRRKSRVDRSSGVVFEVVSERGTDGGSAACHVHFWRTTWSSRISFSVHCLGRPEFGWFITTWADNGVGRGATTTD